MTETIDVGGDTVELVPSEDRKPRRYSRSQRQQRKVIILLQEVTQLETLTKTLLEHLEQAISPRITDADRIRYRCMIQDIRSEMKQQPDPGTRE